MANKKDLISTTELLEFIKQTEQFSDVTRIMDKMENAPVFNDYLYEVLKNHNCPASKAAEESGFERSYFYHILSGKKKNPSRNIVLRIALSIHATFEETQQLLRLAATGALYPKVERDAALIYAIEKKYTMQEANQLLQNLDLAPLYQEEQN